MSLETDTFGPEVRDFKVNLPLQLHYSVNMNF